MERPNDRRGFVHKTIGRIASSALGFIPGGNVIKTGLDIGRTLIGGRGGGGGGAFTPRPESDPGCPAPQFFRDQFDNCLVVPDQLAPGSGPGSCPDGTVWDARGQFCVARTSPFGIGRGAAADFGQAVMGQYGAALEPAVRTTNTRLCPRGAVLGTDGLCYNKRDLKNSERAWPRGRRPLLTGGEMRCISIASSASKKLQRKQKQLQDMGMLPKPTRRKATKALAPGHHAHQAHD